LIGIVVAWYLYGRNPLKAGQLDPLRRLGAIYKGAENKWYVDELYNAIILTPYRKISFFLAEVIDWRFWHDWFHEKVIAGTFNWISNVGLNFYVDQGFIDRIANGLGNGTRSLSAVVRRMQNGFVRSYALSVLFGVVIILGYLILR
jgi:NADH-quinone oxidoreductase subunit L